MRILLTGFEPFGGDVVNPSWEIARTLDGTTVAGAQVVACQLPCMFGRAPQVLRQALNTALVSGLMGQQLAQLLDTLPVLHLVLL